VKPAGQRPVTITPYPDGPLIIRGDFALVEVDGDALPQRRRTIALCRCGASTRKPFCDGSHRATGFVSDDQLIEN
jgi:CDGSH-type Zn-finger protein